MEEIEQFFVCPYCAQKISMLIDLSAVDQRYIEDCEICCRPIEICFTVEENQVVSWSALRTDT